MYICIYIYIYIYIYHDSLPGPLYLRISAHTLAS